MQYAILIYESARDLEIRRADGPAQRATDAAYTAYTTALIEADVMRGGEVLALPETASTLVAQPAGKPLIEDGPFADTKEQLGGFYIVEADNLDEALGWAARCPAASRGRVEVRPLSR